ncbi:molecular chaperone GrpE [Chryseolinea serpens]|jgi:molecular chaperone GrpE|uniref:Protein GrpE n=1 Tax=Chryseolinea serpens TaxID=947013 RepID=A0A1M5WHC1_9BACT|nr:nucleotide exchange factor GrpE [Chryseolinea serpens]SHH86875.1 molecular chaperone GrpE [Chryseolinea serpens]
MENHANENEMSKNEEMISENNEAAENVSAQQEAPAPENGTKEGASAENAVVDPAIKLQQELDEQKDKYIRLYSEFDNFRRRTAKEKLELIQTANEQLLNKLLPVADDFDRAEKSFKDKNDKELEGFFLIANKFRKTLEQSGVKVMEINAQTEFNPDLHEAITQIPVPDASQKGKIVDVVEKGYLLNDKVIRFAKVVVGS